MDKKPYANNSTLSMPANQMRVLKNQVSMLGRAIGNIFLPIVAKVLPYLNQLVYALRELAEWIVKLLGFEDFDWGNATGADNSAIGDLLDDTDGVADNIDKAADNAKKFKNQLQGFDKLNNLTTTDDSDKGSGGTGTGGIDTGLLDAALDDALSRYQKRWDEAFKNMNQSFSTFADNVKKAFEEGGLYGVGRLFAESMTDALNSIPWDTIKEKAGQAGTAIAYFLNGLTDPELFKAAGKTFSEGINTIFSFLDRFVAKYDFGKLGESIAAGLNTAMDMIEWDLIFSLAETAGKKIADLVNGILTLDWEKLGETIANTFTAITKYYENFVKNIKWDELGKSVGGFINGLATYDWKSLGSTIATSVNGIFETLKNALTETDWIELGKNVTEGLYTTFKEFDPSQITGTLSAALSGVYDLLSGILDGIDWKSLPGDIVKKVKDALNGFDFASVASSAGSYAAKLIKAFFDLAAGIKDVFDNVVKDITMFFINKVKEAGWDKDKSLAENGVALIKGVFNGINTFMLAIPTWIHNNIFEPFLKSFVTTTTSENSGLIEQGSKLITSIFDGVIDFMKNIGTWLKTNVFDKVISAFEGATDFFKDVGATIWNGITDAFDAVSKPITATVSMVKDKAFDTVKGSWDAIKNKAATLTASTVNKTKDVLSNVNTAWKSVKDKTATLTANTVNKGKDTLNTLKTGWNTVKTKTATLTGKALDKAETVLSSLKDGWNTIKTKTATLTGKAKNTGANVLKTLTGAWDSLVTKSVTLTATFKDFFTTPLKKAWNAIADAINNGIKAINKIPGVSIPTIPTLATGGYIPNNGAPIKRYASGGIPDIGTLFVAGEAGAEIVGNARGGTEVLNESQIAASIAAGVADANAQQNAIMRQQNQLLREEISVLHAILEKTGITENEIFSAVGRVDDNYRRVNGHGRFAY